MSNYDRIALAIEYIDNHVNQQPSLDEIAAHVNLSPFHFQRLFSRWVGVSPKRFLQILTLEHAKELLHSSKPLLDISNSLGLSSGSRLYDHFVKLEAVTPGEFKTKGKDLLIEYGQHETPFGLAFIAITGRGVCRFSFPMEGDSDQEIEKLYKHWPEAGISQHQGRTRKVIADMFSQKKSSAKAISLLVCGTNFQVSVWRALLHIPPNNLASYSDIARAINNPKSVRAVGQAVGANPVSFLIPCHRVIRQSGQIGGYHWGTTRKHAMHAWEAARF